MGWFSSGPAHAAPEPSKDGGFIAPDRSARQQCWEGRDAFFQCLDRNGIIDSVKEDAKTRKACAPELQAFEGARAESWVCSIMLEVPKSQERGRLTSHHAGDILQETEGL